MKKNEFSGFFYLFVLPVILIALFLFFTRGGNIEAGELDGFAQCLAGKSWTMYGAEWCSHCQNEKNAFGESFKFVPYVECPSDPQKCLAVGISAYPTWIGPDGKKLVGEQGIEKLSQLSGCILPEGR